MSIYDLQLSRLEQHLVVMEELDMCSEEELERLVKEYVELIKRR